MKAFFIKVFEFLQEDSGGMSCRRLVFLYGALIAIPIALIFGVRNPEYFTDILDSILIFVASCIGLATFSKAVDQITKKK